MKIIVAGAGAGKTTSMASVVLDRLKEADDGKIIYVITYTNAARDRIRDLIIRENGSIPRQLHIETTHAFLLREIIFPFNHLVFKNQFTRVSQINLSDNRIFRAIKIKELEGNNIIHVEKVTETAKWVLCRKSNDTKLTRDKRGKILSVICRYLDSVFIDEAQDMDKHFVEVIELLNIRAINIYLIGDPKQDLRGRNAFKQMIELHTKEVEYNPSNHRCPISHVTLSNTYISKLERQSPHSTEVGELGCIFESEIDAKRVVDRKIWNIIYILKKNERFITHEEDRNIPERNLMYELEQLVKKSARSELNVDKLVYSIKKKVLIQLFELDNLEIFKMVEDELCIKLTRQDKGKLGEILKDSRESSAVPEAILVNSIDSVKGLEGHRCLFIVTPDIATYLFSEKKDQNKMLNYLYVALTRAERTLVFLITKEVEEKYTKSSLENTFENLNISKAVYLLPE
jgi:hypothetical protein